MRLYVVDEENKKIYLNKNARSRNELQTLIGSNELKLNNKIFKISDVYAESDNIVTASTIAGGAIGLFGGVIGVALGTIAGGIIGNQVEKNEQYLTNKFNESKLS